MLDAEQFIIHLKTLIDNPYDKRFLLAVSGGVDSCVMAFLFHFHNLNFDVAHCNFHLRGEESDKDMEFVKNISFLNDKTVYIKEFDTFSIQEKSGKSIEMVARELRYQWFSEFENAYDFIATAHHANDNAETILLNLTRGTGLKGMTGIPTMNQKIIRPLLPYRVEEIKQFALLHKIDYRIDHTNREETFYRNKIRGQVIPTLETLNPNLIYTFSKNIAIFKAQYDFYIQEIKKNKEKLICKKNNEYRIDIEALQKHHHGALLLYEILTDFNFHSSTIEEIYQRLRGQAGKVFFSPTHQLLKERKELIITDLTKINPSFSIKIENEDDFRALGFLIEHFSKSSQKNFKCKSNELFIDKKTFTFPFTLRSWQDGDYFYPYGKKGKKKISDLFVEKKINLWQKKKIPLLCIDEKIIWVVGVATDRRFAVDSQGESDFIKMTYIRE